MRSNRGMAYLPLVWGYVDRETAMQEFFELIDEGIARFKCKCRRSKKKYDCNLCYELLTKLKAAVAAEPWRIKRVSLFQGHHANYWQAHRDRRD